MKRIKKKTLKFLLFLILTLGIFPLFSLKTYASDNSKTVRVGYYFSHNFQEGSSDNAYKTGYGYEYLQKVATYTGWRYEYIYGDWNELYQKLVDGEIDLLAGVSYSEERQNQVSYPDYEMLNETFYIYKDTDDASIICGDIPSYSGKKIGTLKNDNKMTAILENWKKENHAEIEILSYDSLNACAEAFHQKEIDAFVSADNIVSSYSGITPVEKIGKEPYYLCVTKKRSDLLEELNLAISMINEQDSLDLGSLRNKYFTETTVSVFLSKQERNWMAEHSSIVIGYVNHYLPYCDTDKDGNVTGLIADIIPDLFDSLPGDYSPDIRYKGFESQKEMLNSLKNGELDFVFPVSDEQWYSEQENYQQSSAIIASPISLVYKTSFKEHTTDKIAVNKSNLLQYCYTMVNYPDSEILMYDNIEDCIHAVESGDAGCTLVSSLRSNQLISNHTKFHALTLSEDEKLCFGVSYGDTALLQLLNHGLNILGDSYGLNHTYRYIDGLSTYTLTDFLIDNIWFFTGLLILLMVCVVLYFIHREQLQQEATKKELEQKKKLETALISAKQAAVARRVFLRNMSHDIRTPMNAVIGFTNLALQSTNTTQIHDYLSKILVSSKHLLSIVNDILEISRIESGQTKLDETESCIIDIVSETDIIIRGQAQEKQQNFIIDISQIQSPYIICDKLRIKEILVNLLGNSVKFTPSGGEISLTVLQTPCEKEGYGNYEIHVKDNGCGMSSEFIKRIFMPFERASTSTISGVEGTGLGMPIVKSFVDMMGGTIDILSEEGKGTEIIIKLQQRTCAPRSDKQSESLPIFADVSNQFSQKRILLAEDNALNQEIASAILEEIGFEVDVAENGAIAIEKLKVVPSGFYFAVLMDIQMPVLDGYEAATQIRALSDKAISQIPILAVSANAFDEDKVQSYEAGMNGHLAKPLDAGELIKALKKFL